MDAVQIMTNTVNPVPVGAGPQAVEPGRGAASNLFRAMFEEAAATAAPQGGPSPFPANAVQPTRDRKVSALFFKGAASPADPLMAGRAEEGEPGVREAETASLPVTGGAWPQRHVGREQSPETRPGFIGRGDGRKGGAKGMPPGIQLEQALAVNLLPREQREESVTENPSEKGDEPTSPSEREPVPLLEGNMLGRSDSTATNVPAGRDVPPAGHGASVTVSLGVAKDPRTGAGSRKDDLLIPVKAGMEVPGFVQRRENKEIVAQSMPPANGVESSRGEPNPLDAGMKSSDTETAMKRMNVFSAHRSDGVDGKNPGSSAVPPGFPEIDETDSRVTENHRGGTNKVVGNGLENVMQRHDQELKSEVKGETVLRQLPGGVTVLNPAQTTGRVGVTLRDEGSSAVTQLEAKGRTSIRSVEEQGLETAEVEPAEALNGKREASSPWDGAERHGNSEAGKGSQAFTVNPTSLAEPEVQVRGIEETQSSHASDTDKGRLHEEILSQVREKLANHTPVSGDGRITIKLNPGELGELQLNVRMDDRKMSVEVTAQNPVVKEALLQNLDQLKDTLSRQNIQMERFDVSTGTGQQGAGQSFREGRQTAHRQFDDMPFSPAGYFREDTAAAAVAGWEPRENSLVDMRL